jgi:dipeptidyl aminopeptidase/acylaminoacyl peptidase
VAKRIAPYGAWASPISIEEAASTGDPFFGYTIVDFDDGGLVWLEPRPAQAGRSALMRNGEEVTPADFDARTRVHEYGGGAVWTAHGAIFASSFADGRVYRVEDGTPRPVTPEPPQPNALRYADGFVSGVEVICVRESHGDTGVVNELVSFPVDGGEVTPVHTGRDFYAAPRVGPDGRLAYLAWDHPLLPFLGCELWVDGDKVAGGANEAVFQPEWGPDGALYWVSDAGGGWWNLYRDGERLTALEAELGYPFWVFGLRSYAFLQSGRIACTVIERGLHSFAVLEPKTGELDRLDLPFTASMPYVTAHGNRFAVVAGAPTEPAGIHIVDSETGSYETVVQQNVPAVESASISHGRAIEFESNGRKAHAFFYAPTNAGYEAPDGEKPPLRVIIHGGPTSQAKLAFHVFVQFYTSRGWAVVDVNYGGSTGFGRPYRELLDHQWGVVDIEDCVAAARHLAETGEVDATRCSIVGGSAGGYTTLLALAVSDAFAAGISSFGVADLVTFAETTHKFESRYMDWLLGPLPEALDVYRERSPVTHADRIKAPLLIAQGLEDKVVPPAQAEAIVAALERNNVPHLYVPLAGEGHGFRRRESAIRLVSIGLSFFGRIFGFQPADRVERVEIKGL